MDLGHLGGQVSRPAVPDSRSNPLSRPAIVVGREGRGVLSELVRCKRTHRRRQTSATADLAGREGPVTLEGSAERRAGPSAATCASATSRQVAPREMAPLKQARCTAQGRIPLKVPSIAAETVPE